MTKKTISNIAFSDNEGNTFQIIPPPPSVSLKLAASFKNIRSGKHALELQIKKWSLIYDQCCQGGLLDDGGIGTSALCQLYFFSYPEQCADCPVSMAGYPQCKDTPYWDYQDALEFNNIPEGTKAASAEMGFLKSLLDEQ